MTADQQQRLTANVKRDGGLTSLPLVWLMQGPDGAPTQEPPIFEIVSGNHRVTSAKEADLGEIDCIVILNFITPERRLEIQLAHNAVGGQDDLSVLEGLYEQLGLAGKEYSGLTDDMFNGLKDLSLTGFSVDGPAYQEIMLTFLPEDAAQFEALVARAKKGSKRLFHLAHLKDFDAFFEAIVRTKDAHNVQNSAVAIGLVAELALQRLDQLEGEAKEPEAGSADDLTVIEDAAPPATTETFARTEID